MIIYISSQNERYHSFSSTNYFMIYLFPIASLFKVKLNIENGFYG